MNRRQFLQSTAAAALASSALARSSGAKYEKPDGSPLAIDRDFFGARRSATLPSAGPLENPGAGLSKLRLR